MDERRDGVPEYSSNYQGQPGGDRDRPDLDVGRGEDQASYSDSDQTDRNITEDEGDEPNQEADYSDKNACALGISGDAEEESQFTVPPDFEHLLVHQGNLPMAEQCLSGRYCYISGHRGL